MSAAAATSLAKLRGQPSSRISEREQQIIAMFASGKGAQQIADLLHLSVATVNTHRTNIMRKLRIHSSIFLVHYALAHGLVQNKFEAGSFYGS